MKHRLLPKKCELYHGNEKTRPYFEGWYFKHATEDAGFVMAVICGVSRSQDAADDHSFIQIITGPEHTSRYIRFAYDAFEWDKTRFFVRVGDNTFSYDGIHIDIERKDITIKADLEYSGHIYLDTNVFAPSIMGPFSYIPGMECNHGVLSLKNRVRGSVVMDGTAYDMAGAAGYIEKDWGEAFPDAWIWLQGNLTHTRQEAAFMCSVASIPFGPAAFTGLICVLAAGGRQYRFATYNGAKIQSLICPGSGADIVLKRGGMKLCIKAHAAGFRELIGPTRNGMDRTLFESVSGEIELSLYKNEKLIFETRLLGCGMEVSEAGSLTKG